MNRRLALLATSSLVQLLAVWFASPTAVSCAGGRLALGGPTVLTGRSQGTAVASGSRSKQDAQTSGQKEKESGRIDQLDQQDLIKVCELVDATSQQIRWEGGRLASEMAAESRVVAVHLSGKSPIQGQVDRAELYQVRLETKQANKTKQAQDFETDHQQQQLAGSNTSRPEPSDEVALTSTRPPEPSSTSDLATGSEQFETTSSTPTTTALTSSLPPGWPQQPSSSTGSGGDSSSTASPPPVAPTTSNPVGVRIDREGDAVLCGEANANGKSNAPNRRPALDRIVGGHKTEPGEFPFQVRLNIRSRRGSGICGGVVLDRWHVLTAAHCMTACVSHQLTTATIETTGVKVTVGDHAIRSDDGELELEAASITPHERYDACNFYANDHDIALIKTAAPIPFKFTTDGYGSVNRPCMPANSSIQYRDGEMAIVSGWGVTRENSGALSNILRYVQVPIVNVTRCQETYGARVTQDHLCAGFQAGGKDSCQGDSGGPLVRVVDNRYELMGIVSFGYGCGQAGAAGVYTRVASYLDWIKANTNDL